MSTEPRKGYVTAKQCVAYIPADTAGETLTERRLQQMFADGTLPERNQHGQELRYQYNESQAKPKYYYSPLLVLQGLVIHWRNKAASKGKNISEAREEKLRRETELLAIKLAEKKKLLMLVADHERIIAAMTMAAKNKLLALPSRLIEVVPANLKQEVLSHATSLIHQALTELAEGEDEQAKQRTQTKKMI